MILKYFRSVVTLLTTDMNNWFKFLWSLSKVRHWYLQKGNDTSERYQQNCIPRRTTERKKIENLLPAGGTTWSSSFGLVRFQIFFITARSSSLAVSMFPVS